MFDQRMDGFREVAVSKCNACTDCFKHCRCSQCCSVWCGDCSSCSSTSCKAGCIGLFFCCSLNCWYYVLIVGMFLSILINIAIHLVATFTYMDTFEQMDRSYRDSTIALSAQDKDVRFIEMFVSSVGEILFYVFWCVIQACSFSNLEFTKTHFRFLADGWSRMGVFHIFMSLWAFSRIVNDSFLETDAYNARMVTGSLFAVQAFFGFVAALFGCCGGQASVEERKKDRDLELSPL